MRRFAIALTTLGLALALGCTKNAEVAEPVDPALVDQDADGIADVSEDRNRNGVAGRQGVAPIGSHPTWPPSCGGGGT